MISSQEVAKDVLFLVGRLKKWSASAVYGTFGSMSDDFSTLILHSEMLAKVILKDPGHAHLLVEHQIMKKALKKIITMNWAPARGDKSPDIVQVAESALKRLK